MGGLEQAEYLCKFSVMAERHAYQESAQRRLAEAAAFAGPSVEKPNDA
jgi:hypothetical protein